MCAGERGARQDIKPKANNKATPQEKDRKERQKRMRRREKDMKDEKINTEEARARHYTKVAAWFTFAQQPLYAAGEKPPLAFGKLPALRPPSPSSAKRRAGGVMSAMWATSQRGKRCGTRCLNLKR
jgi:hypothetical protein